MKTVKDWVGDQKHNMQLMLDQLHYHEIKEVRVQVQGANDEGQIYIESACTVDDEENDAVINLLRGIKVSHTKMPEQYDNYGGVGTAILRDWDKNPPSLAELIEEVCYRELEHTRGGWELNGGSSGHIYIEPLATFENRKPFVVDICENYDHRGYDYDDEEYNDE